MSRERDLGFIIRCLANQFRRGMDSEAERSPDPFPTGIHGWIIGYMSQRGDAPVYQCELEGKFEVRRSTMTEILNVMERNGLICRRRDPKDARRKQLELTDRARQLHNAVMAAIHRVDAAALEGIPEEELDAFFATASKVKDNLEQHRIREENTRNV